jgi:hypothetical protein
MTWLLAAKLWGSAFVWFVTACAFFNVAWGWSSDEAKVVAKNIVRACALLLASLLAMHFVWGS